jgi:hypothetical protein
VVNVATVGLGGPVVSTAEDVSAVGLTVLALVAPLLGIVAIVGVLFFIGRAAARRLTSWRAAPRSI